MTQLWCIGCDAFFDKRDDVRGEDYFIDRDGECWCADCWEDRKRAKRTGAEETPCE